MNERPSIAVWLFVGLLGLATLGGLLVHPALALAPTLGLLVLGLLSRLPLHWLAQGLLFLGLVLEAPGDLPAGGLWRSPLYPLGAILLDQLKHVTGISALVMTGVDVCVVLLFLLYAWRRAQGQPLGGGPWIALPQPLVLALLLAIGMCFVLLLWGLGTGGSLRFAQWQLQRIIYLPVVTLLMGALLPGPQVVRSLGTLLVVAALIRAAYAIYVRRLFPELDYTSTHPDSILFAAATCLLVLQLAEKPGAVSLRRVIFCVPFLVWGMLANERRLVWVEIILAATFLFFLTRFSRIKLKLYRAAILSIPLVLIYLTVGWNSGNAIFKPVATIRSVVDSKSDQSTEWRDLENYNLFITARTYPVLGTGFGHPFIEAVELPDVTSGYELEPYVPHNSLLGLWAYTGYLGFSVLWMPLVVAAFLALRGYHHARDPTERIACMTTIAVLVIYMVHCYGDMGLGTWASVFIVSAALVVSSKTAAANGAWPVRGARASPREVTPSGSAPRLGPGTDPPLPRQLRSGERPT